LKEQALQGDQRAQFVEHQSGYNEEGQLTDRGTTEGAEAIMTLLVEDWGYPVNEADLDPNDPLVNSATEYMFQMATIAYHTLTGWISEHGHEIEGPPREIYLNDPQTVAPEELLTRVEFPICSEAG